MSTDDDLSRLYRNILVWLPICALIFILLSKLMENKDEADKVNFQTMSKRFATHINLIHLHWLQVNKPSSIIWPEPKQTESSRTIKLNQQGWPIPTNQTENLINSCQQLWHDIQLIPLKQEAVHINALPLIKKEKWQGCKFSYLELSFNYWFIHGRLEYAP